MKNKIILGLTMVSLLSPSAMTFASAHEARAKVPADIKARLDDLKKEREELKTKRDAERETDKAVRGKSAAEPEKRKSEEAKKKVEEVRKRVLLKLVDLQIKHFKKTGERVAKMPNISDDLKAQLTAEIEKSVADFEALKKKVQEAATREQLEALAKEIRDNFKTHRDLVKKIVDAIHASRVSGLVSKVEEQVKKAETKIAEAKAAGKDAAAAEAKLAEAKTKLAEAKLLASQNKSEQVIEVLKAVRKLLEEIGDLLK